MIEIASFADAEAIDSSAKMYSQVTPTLFVADMLPDVWNMSSVSEDPNSTASPEDQAPVQNVAFQHYIAPIIYSLVFGIGTVGNGLVIIVLMKYPNMRTIPNVYILSLAIVDFMFVLSLPLQGYQIIANHWPFGFVMCKFAGVVDGINQFASVNILTIMSADRYVAVVYPLSSMRYRTKKTARIACGIVFLVSFVMSTPTWYYMSTSDVQPNGHIFCFVQWDAEWDPNGFFYVMYMFVLGFLVPLIVIIMCYSTLLFKILGSKLRIRSDGTGTAQRASKRVLILTVSVIVAFVVCWLPFNVVSLLIQFVTKSHAMAIAFNITACWCYTNSCFNPLIYTFIGENFKNNLMELCPCCTSPEDTKLDRYRSNRESSTYIRGGTLRLHSVQHDTVASTTTPCTAATDDTSFMEPPPNICVQTYTFANNNSHNSCNKE